jgi:hypothetical protein
VGFCTDSCSENWSGGTCCGYVFLIVFVAFFYLFIDTR